MYWGSSSHYLLEASELGDDRCTCHSPETFTIVLNSIAAWSMVAHTPAIPYTWTMFDTNVIHGSGSCQMQTSFTLASCVELLCFYLAFWAPVSKVK
eukprot:3731631-Pleurochrysis_carterae.AAC.3